MAKKRHPRRAPEPRPTEPRTPAPPRAVALPPRSESWWFDFTIDRHHLALLRFLLFGVLAVDAFLQIAQAPRYGAGDFNVPQLGWLPLPTPSRELMLLLDLAMTYLLAMAALGVATRFAVPIAAGLDFYGYFSSQLDSYQHHYLVVMLLVCASFVPWHDPSPRVKSWALRLFTVQVAILYLWAAISKLDPRWLDGTALEGQLRPAWIRDLMHGLPGGAATMATAVMLGELALAVAWLWRRTWPYALGVGVAFHASVELAEFQIGQFSFVMCAVYSLMVPAQVAAIPGAVVAQLRDGLPRGAGIGALALLLGLILGVIAWSMVPLPITGWFAFGTIAVAIAGFASRPTWGAGVAHVAAWGLIVLLATGTDEPLDYHKYWAGSARRLGQTEEMRRAYHGLVEIAPDHGPANYYLGGLALKDGRADVALMRFRRAQRGQPTAARGWLGEAEAQLALGDLAAVKQALDRADAVEPGNADVAKLRAALDAGTAPPELDHDAD